MSGFAWVTLATNDSYSLGALVLAHSLRRANTAHQLAILITPGVTEAMRTQLSAVYNVVKVVDVLDSRDEANLTLLARPELGITFTKLHCWRLTQFSKCVFLDADTLVLQNCDELFEREELSAAPDAGWPDCFNSGVFVFKPSNDTFKKLIDFAVVHGSFDGGDQGLLNLYFKDWATKDITKHLPFVYNMCSTATYSYLPAFKQFGENLKIIHFIGSSKPWLQVFDTETGLARVSGESQSIGSFVQLWWDLFCNHVHPSLSTEMAGLAAALATLTIGSPLSTEQTALQEHLRRQGWEQGNIDYMGRDSFDNIWLKISETLNITESADETPQIEETPSASVTDSPVPSKPTVSKPLAPLEMPSSEVPKLPTPPATSIAAATSPPPSTPPVTVAVALTSPATSPVATPIPTPITPPVFTSTTPPIAIPITPPVAAPSTPTVAPPTTPPVAKPTTPVLTPTSPPGATPTAPPVAAPTTPPVAAPTTPPVAAPTTPPVAAPPVAAPTTPPVAAPTTPPVVTPTTPPVATPTTPPVVTPTLPVATPIASPAIAPQVVPEPTKSKPVPAAQPESPPVIPAKAATPLSPPTTKPTQPSPLTPPISPKTEVLSTKSAQPSTPTVTSPTPPTSPPVDPFESALSTKLKVDPETPDTPPVGAHSTGSGEPPVPPKRKGGKAAQAQEQTSKAQPKGGKSVKGKK